MKDFQRLIEESLKEVRAVGIKPGNIVEWKINTRAKTRWGQCTKDPFGRCSIEIAEVLLADDRVSEMDCKATIIHEILHTCPECSGHTGKWKHYAEVMNYTYGYNIKRTTSGEAKGLENHKSEQMDVKYIFECSVCGAKIYRKRDSKFTKNYKQYGCGRCGNGGCFKLIYTKP